MLDGVHVAAHATISVPPYSGPFITLISRAVSFWEFSAKL
jgi:hypothetical protein